MTYLRYTRINRIFTNFQEILKFANKYRIASTRLINFDYSQIGAYFVTICTKDRINYFGYLKNNKVELSDFGKIIDECWLDLDNHYPNLILDNYVIMPNHFHGILFIDNDNIPEIGLKPDSKKIHGLSEFIRAFKSFSSKKINDLRGISNPSIWQARYYERVIRNEKELYNCRNYIQNNPINWEVDEYFV